MKYMLLIHQGDTPPPGTPEWDHLSEDERKRAAADYQAVSSTPGVTPGSWMEPPELATTVRVDGGKTLATDGPFVAVKEALGGTCSTRRTTSTPRSSSRRVSRRRGWAEPSRCGP